MPFFEGKMVVKNELKGNIECTLYDIDGTLTYFSNMEDMVKEAYPQYEDDSIKKHMIGVSKLLEKSRTNNTYFSIENYAKEQQRALNISLKEAYQLIRRLIELTPKYIESFDGVVGTLNALDYDSIAISDWFYNSQVDKLTKAGIENKIRKIYTCEGDYAKPNAVRYINVLEKEGLDPKACVMIGDSYNDLGARRVGIPTILIDYNQKKRHLYKDSTAVITEFSDLSKILRRK